MKKIIITALLSLLLFNFITASAQQPLSDNISKETILYAVKGADSLFMDVYGQIDQQGDKPCIMFMFGGAFARGTRDRDDYIPYFTYLVQRGYCVVSIDYRLGLKNIGDVPNLTDEIAAGMLINSINWAVDDLLDATEYLLSKTSIWNINPHKIVLNGSSAGAVTVLQVIHELNNGKHRERLPQDFNYAGVIAMAGAILSLDGKLTWTQPVPPIMFMHGDADRQVPYNVLRLGEIGFFGSRYISDQFLDAAIPHSFYSFDDFGHEIASLPIREYMEEVGSFLKHFIEDTSEPKIVLERQFNFTKPRVEKKDFTVADFLNGNFGL